jgi:chemotaxis protein methyltransferase CheR
MPAAPRSAPGSAAADIGPTIRAGEMRLFQDLIYREAGINLPDVKASLVQGRLRKRLDALGLDSFRDYHAYVIQAHHQDELQECLEALTTNETFFFRHKQHWDFVLGTVLPEWQKTAPRGATFRAWSAASSTGEEPYSLAIALDAGLANGSKGTVDATDINTKVLARAKAGLYGDYALQKLTPQCLKRYFHPCPKGDRHQVNDDLRAMVHFSQHNLQEPSHGAPYDLVMLRNVLIYFDAASKATVIRHMAPRIKPGGWIFLGGAETLSDSCGQFTYVRPTIYRKQQP